MAQLQHAHVAAVMVGHVAQLQHAHMAVGWLGRWPSYSMHTVQLGWLDKWLSCSMHTWQWADCASGAAAACTHVTGRAGQVAQL